ncbi:protein phosphatase 2C domain-containing protein [Streptomyces sp. WI04-05B]|uniref:protein phosphatase 2C domain-containing protein n=1 Tax=Streptomyces TaxID=1883 RepID=UPI0029B45C96|nr:MULTISPECIES: protein phosphatase 2C domain-containing protein [unclassified Streptomyces]MDX2543478.1 protein phosphatase 2C domain-containing protein [Streptomyces sp. WI04-05B]MDX2589147.1 protein phosphatase 2C domain-containing protein [Streptomyces sp. WI04-05A]
MSQQGERSTGHEDDWWGQLYDDSTEDTGPTAAGDSLDDRFASASGTVDAVPERDGGDAVFGRETVSGDASRASGIHEASGAYEEWDELGVGVPPRVPPPPARPVAPPVPLPPPRAEVPHGLRDTPRSSGSGRPRAPWEPPPAMPPGPASFPPGPKPAGFRDKGQPSAFGAAFVDGGAGTTTGESARASDAELKDVDVVDAARTTPATVPPRDAIPDGSVQDGFPVDSAPRDISGLTLDGPPRGVDHVGSGPPTYAPEPTALPPADPDDLGDLVADTVLDGARYGACTLRAVSLRGDSARFRGEPRRDSLLTARFGAGDHALVLIAMATGARATPGAHRAAAEACQWIGRAVGRSHVRLAEDLRAARRGDLKSGLHRLTDRSLGKLRASAAEQGIEPEEYTAGLRCLLLPADPECRTRVFFGVGAGGLFRLRDGEWQDIEPRITEIPAGEPVVGFGSPPHETPDGDRLTMDLGITTPPSPYEPAPEPPREPFRFRASVARPGDTLLLCTGGLADPLRGEPELCEYLTGRWSGGTPPGLAAFLADTQVRVKGYADDRTAAAVWET